MNNEVMLSNMWSNRHFPSIFNPSIFDDLFDDQKIFSINSAYPYDLIAIKDKDGNIKQLQIQYALAGFDASEVSTKVIGNELKITAEKKAEEKSDSENVTVLHQGIAKRMLKVTFSLGPDIDKSGIKSKFNNGLLTIFLPTKAEEIIDIPVE